MLHLFVSLCLCVCVCMFIFSSFLLSFFLLLVFFFLLKFKHNSSISNYINSKVEEKESYVILHHSHYYYQVKHHGFSAWQLMTCQFNSNKVWWTFNTLVSLLEDINGTEILIHNNFLLFFSFNDVLDHLPHNFISTPCSRSYQENVDGIAIHPLDTVVSNLSTIMWALPQTLRAHAQNGWLKNKVWDREGKPSIFILNQTTLNTSSV